MGYKGRREAPRPEKASDDKAARQDADPFTPVSYTHLRAHET